MHVESDASGLNSMFRFPRIIVAVFVALGLYWVAASLVGGIDAIVIGVGVINILTAVIVGVGVRHFLLKALCVGVALYDCAVLSFQAYAFIGLLNLGFVLYGWLGGLGYGLLAAFVLILAVASYMSPELQTRSKQENK